VVTSSTNAWFRWRREGSGIGGTIRLDMEERMLDLELKSMDLLNPDEKKVVSTATKSEDGVERGKTTSTLLELISVSWCLAQRARASMTMSKNSAMVTLAV
jgi:hypothetical protein